MSEDLLQSAANAVRGPYDASSIEVLERLEPVRRHRRHGLLAERPITG